MKIFARIYGGLFLVMEGVWLLQFPILAGLFLMLVLAAQSAK
jgi:hypothetical protein